MTREEKLQRIAELDNPVMGLLHRVQTLKGDKGDKGDSIVGPKGEKGDKGYQGDSIVGPKGEKGDKGTTVLLRGPKGEKGDTVVGPKGDKGDEPSVEQIVKQVLTELTSGKKLTVDHIDGLTGGLKQLKEFLQRGGYRGGGDTVLPGTGVTITTDINGHKLINSTGGATTYSETPTGLINGVNTTYTVLHAINTVFSLVINGQFLHPTADYTVAGTTITMVTPLPIELAGTSFTIVYQ